MTSPEVAKLISASNKTIVLFPVGCLEPHGPHLPLATDTLISESVATRAANKLAEHGVTCVIAPSLPYGVTNCAAGFAGATTVSPETMLTMISEICGSFLNQGFDGVCLINNHLEPAQYSALKSCIGESISLACPLDPEWGRRLGEEFRKGECHGGQYETSIALAGFGDLVKDYSDLPEVAVSLSDALREGKTTFSEMGLHQAYAGNPSAATVNEGHRLLDILASMVADEALKLLPGC